MRSLKILHTILFIGKYEIAGSFAELIDLYSKTMNFTFTIEPPPDWNWGGQQEDGTWNGMMYLVQHRLVDIGYLVTLDLNMNYFPILLYYSHYIFDSN